LITIHRKRYSSSLHAREAGLKKKKKKASSRAWRWE
jgi:hypothetical protein